jgi:Kef-type K+ transport system membrane component KefB
MYTQAEHAGTLILLGLLLLGAVLAARLARRLGLPAMTGHFAAGLAIGTASAPLVVSAGEVLSAVHQALGAVLLFWIGSQLTLARGRPHQRRMAGLAAGTLVRRHRRSVASLVAAALVSVLPCALALAVALPLLSDAATLQALPWTHVLVTALALSATSPTVIAVVGRENRADGRYPHATLDAAVLANVVIFVLIILVLGISVSSSDRMHLAGGASPLALIADLFAGLAVGGTLAALAALRPRALLCPIHVTLAAVAFLVLRQELVHAEVAIMAGSLLAGIALANSGRDLPVKLQPAILGIGTALFVVAGALADVHGVIAMAAPAAMLFSVRALSLWLGARLAGTVARDDLVRRLGFAPLLPQAGFSLAIVAAFDALGVFSPELLSLVLAVALINELAMPPVLRLAMRAASSQRLEER